MNANQRRLRALYEARDARLVSEVPDSTIRRQIETGRVRSEYTLALYVRLGMPIEEWLPKADKKRLNKVCPLPIPDRVYNVPRPDTVAALAGLVAAELRHPRGIRALSNVLTDGEIQIGYGVTWARYSLHHSDFDNLTPLEIADVIQAKEATTAAEWAGDT